MDAKGVFARTPVKRGTVLGAYPGRVRSEGDMVDKATVVPCCRSYVFKYAQPNMAMPLLHAVTAADRALRKLHPACAFPMAEL